MSGILGYYGSSDATRLKQRGRVGKWVVKKAMEPYLPHDVIYRPQTGFGAHLRRWMRHDLSEITWGYTFGGKLEATRII